jgi:hypothetical protein
VTRAYLRLDPRFDERKSHYPDGAYRALVACLCLAELQPDRGRFRSMAFLRALLERRGRWVPYLIEQGDLVTLPDGRLYIDGWDEWQEGDVTVKERMDRLRRRRRRDGDGYGGRNGTDRNHGDDGDYASPLDRRITPRTDSGGGAKRERSAVAPGPASGMSVDETREHLDRLRDALRAQGIVPPDGPSQLMGSPSPETDEELIARCRAILADETAPDWKRDAARTQLQLMRALP